MELLRASLIFLALLAPSPGASAPALPASAAPATTSIAGSVIDPDGRTLGGAAVILRWSARVQPEYTFQASTVCDREGRFVFAGLPSGIGEARIAAHVPGRSLATAAEGLPVDLAPAARSLTVVAEPGSVLRVSFRVPAGLPPAEGALTMDKAERWVPFGAGEALLTGLPSGSLGIKYHTEVYGGGVFFLQMSSGRSKDTVIDLGRPDWIEGKVVDAHGSPVSGVLFRAENAFRGMGSRTGVDGIFRLRRPRAGALHVHFRDPRFRDTLLVLGGAGRNGRGAGEGPIEVRLDPGAGPIVGKVSPFEGRPEACLVIARPVDARLGAPARPRWPGGETRLAAPGGDGEFRVSGLASEAYRVRVECPGANLAEDTALPGSALKPARLGPARGLAGRVVRRVDGSAVAAFMFKAQGFRSECPEAALRDGEARGDSLGRFSLPARHEGGSWVCAAAPGLAPACRGVPAGDTAPALVELERGLVLRVRALALGAAGDTTPLMGARVRLRRVGCRAMAWSGETDSAGRFAAEDLAPGEYAVDVREGGRLPFRKSVDLVSDSGLDAILPEGAVLAGTLLGSDGRPPRGLRVLARPVWPSDPGCPGGIVEGPVGPDGSFRLAGLGNCPVTLAAAATRSRHAPFLPLWRADGVRPGREPLAMVLPPARAWEISAVSAGLPLPGDAEVHILLPPASDSLPGEVLGHSLGRSTFRGTYAFNAYAGVRYVAVVSARGYRERADTVVIPPGDEPFETRIEIPAWPALRGRVETAATAETPATAATAATAATPAGIAGLRVSGPRGTSAETDAEGRFRLEGLPPGPAALAIHDGEGRLIWAGHSGRGSGGGEEDVIPLSDTSVEISGLAVDAEGRPAAGAALLIRRREAREEGERISADGRGRFALRLPPGAWLACPEDPSLACTRVRPGAADTAKVRMSQGTRKVTVACKLPMPTPLPGGAVLIGPAGPLFPSESRDGDLLHPVASFRGVPAGRHEVHAAAFIPAGAPAGTPGPATLWWSSAFVDQGAELGPPGPGVLVTALDPQGKPLRGVGIRFLPREGQPGIAAGIVGTAGTAGTAGRAWGEAEGWQPPAAVLAGTDAAGTLLCLGVQPGRYWIYASHATHAAAPLAWDLPKANAAAVNLTLSPASPIRLKVTYLGQVVAGASAEVFDTLGNRAAPPAAGRDGELLECGSFAPGRYRVAVAAPGLGRQVRVAEVSRGVEANLEAALPASGWLEVVGQGLEDKVFYLKDANDKRVSLIRQAEMPPLGHDGRPGTSRLFHGIVPQRYQLWMEGGRLGLGEVEIKPAALTVVDVGRLERVRVALPARRG